MAALAVATLLVYIRATAYPFVNYDDNAYVSANSHVNTGLSWPTVRWALTSVEMGNWHPVTWISHALDCQVFGLSAGGHHATSILLHALNAVLLFLLLARVTGDPWRSAIVATVFALHPFNVESVAWVAERKTLLCTLFFLLTLGAYGWYTRKPKLQRYLAVVFLFALALASKAMVVTLPFVLLLLDYWPLGRILGWTAPSAAFPVLQERFPSLVKEKLPLLALSAAGAVIAIVAQRHAAALASISAWTIGGRVANALHAYGSYLWKALLPIHLAPFYPASSVAAWKIILAALFLSGTSVLIWKSLPRRPYLVVGWLWFLGTLVPVIGIVQVGSQSMADRYTYVPLIGIFVACVWGISEIASFRSWNIRYVGALTCSGLVALSLLSWRQLGYWGTSEDLWTHCLRVTGSNFVADENLAVALLDRGREDEAFPHFVNVTSTVPEDPVALLNIGNYLEKHGHHQEAIAKFETVSRTTKDPAKLAGAYRGLGVAYAELGDRTNARKNFLRALQISPNPNPDLYNLSLLETSEAIDKMSTSVAAHPTAQGYLQLGQLLREGERIPDAQTAYRKALHLDPTLRAAKQALEDLKASAD